MDLGPPQAPTAVAMRCPGAPSADPDRGVQPDEELRLLRLEPAAR